MAGTVTIRHGSGVYVGHDDDSFVMSNPVFRGVPSKKVLLDLCAHAEANLDNDDVLTNLFTHEQRADLERWDPDTHPIRS